MSEETQTQETQAPATYTHEQMQAILQNAEREKIAILATKDRAVEEKRHLEARIKSQENKAPDITAEDQAYLKAIKDLSLNEDQIRRIGPLAKQLTSTPAEGQESTQALIQAEVAKLNEAHDKRFSELETRSQKEIADAKAASEKASIALSSARIDTAITAALTSAKILPEAHKYAALELQQRARFDAEKQQVVFLDNNGEDAKVLDSTSNGLRDATADEFMAAYQKENSFLFEHSRGAGNFANGANGQPAQGGKDENPFMTGNRALRAKLRKDAPDQLAKFEAEWKAAGSPPAKQPGQ